MQDQTMDFYDDSAKDWAKNFRWTAIGVMLFLRECKGKPDKTASIEKRIKKFR